MTPPHGADLERQRTTLERLRGSLEQTMKALYDSAKEAYDSALEEFKKSGGTLPIDHIMRAADARDSLRRTYSRALEDFNNYVFERTGRQSSGGIQT